MARDLPSIINIKFTSTIRDPQITDIHVYMNKESKRWVGSLYSSTAVLGGNEEPAGGDRSAQSNDGMMNAMENIYPSCASKMSDKVGSINNYSLHLWWESITIRR